ncbi:MAG TPA: serine protease [Solirubrobacteraceae bacterium]|nr:serine protease [Solirubrobacteraceae bacterium]
MLSEAGSETSAPEAVLLKRTLPLPAPLRRALLLPATLLLAALAATALAPPATAIIGGVSAQTGTFPSLAYVVDFQGQLAYQCTGTVIAPSLVLTAGHCAENMQTGAPFNQSGFRVVTGAVDPLQPGDVVSTVLGVILYPGLERKVDNGDVALLVLSTPTSAPPIVLANPEQAKRLDAGAPATIVGWGKTAFEQTTLTEQLQSASTVVQARKWCRRNAPPFFARSEICTIAPPSYATGVCQGDSGGPLLASGPSGEPVEVGVADHVYGRCSTRHPSVFASVGSIYRWVQTWIAAYRLPTAPPAPPTTLPTGPVPQPAPS